MSPRRRALDARLDQPHTDPEMESLGKSLIVVGGLLVILGALLYAGPSLPSLPFLGKLPGDLRIERPGLSFYFPLTTCIVVSAIVTLLLYLFSRFR